MYLNIINRVCFILVREAIILLEAKLKWSDFINISELRIDIEMPEDGRGYWQGFDQKYSDLRGWGLYMYIHQRQKIAYVGETAREGERPFRERVNEELKPNSTFCSEMEKLGIKVDSFEPQSCNSRISIY